MSAQQYLPIDTHSPHAHEHLKRENRNLNCLLGFSKARLPFIAISAQPVLIEPHTCMHPCPDGKTHQITTRSNVDGIIIEPCMIRPPAPPPFNVDRGRGVSKARVCNRTLKIRGAGCEYVLGGTLFSERMFSKITLPCRGLNNSTIYVIPEIFQGTLICVYTRRPLTAGLRLSF